MHFISKNMKNGYRMTAFQSGCLISFGMVLTSRYMKHMKESDTVSKKRKDMVKLAWVSTWNGSWQTLLLGVVLRRCENRTTPACSLFSGMCTGRGF